MEHPQALFRPVQFVLLVGDHQVVGRNALLDRGDLGMEQRHLLVDTVLAGDHAFDIFFVLGQAVFQLSHLLLQIFPILLQLIDLILDLT